MECFYNTTHHYGDSSFNLNVQITFLLQTHVVVWNVKHIKSVLRRMVEPHATAKNVIPMMMSLVCKIGRLYILCHCTYFNMIKVWEVEKKQYYSSDITFLCEKSYEWRWHDVFLILPVLLADAVFYNTTSTTMVNATIYKNSLSSL